MTELSECFFEPIIECSMIRPGSRLGNYLIGEDDELAYWRVAAERSIRKPAAFSNTSRTGYPSIAAVYEVMYPPSSDDPYVAYSANSMLHISADLVCTNGQGCTVIESKSFGIGICGMPLNQRRRPFLAVFNSGSGWVAGTIYIVDAGDSVFETSVLESARQVKRREHLKLAHRLAVEGLKAAEESRARAVEKEAMLGIDWEDDSH